MTFTDTVSGVTFTFDSGGNNPVTVGVRATRTSFFIDAITGITYYIDTADNRVEALSYLPETTQYAFTPADGKTYLIHYNDVRVAFPVISGANVNAGVATVGSEHVHRRDRPGRARDRRRRRSRSTSNSFEINGNLYTITGTPAGADYSACSVAGSGTAPHPFTSPNTFALTDPSVTYTLQLDAANLPHLDHRYLPGQAQPRPDLGQRRHLPDHLQHGEHRLAARPGPGGDPDQQLGLHADQPFDATTAKFIFADLDIFNAASVVGQFTAYLAPTFFIGGATYTLDTVHLMVTRQRQAAVTRCCRIPTMFSINGFNYVIDTNRTPHAIVGNDNMSPLPTDVTVSRGNPVPHSTFTLNGQVYEYVEDAGTMCSPSPAPRATRSPSRA